MGNFLERFESAKQVNGKELAQKLEQFAVIAHDLKEQASRAVVETEEHYAKGGDLIKIIRAQDSKADDTRLAATKPLRNMTTLINDSFKPSAALRKDARAAIETKMSTWMREENKRIAAEAEAERKRIEEEALARAEESGDDADEVLDAAVEEAKSVKASVGLARGDYGSTTGTTTVHSLEVTHLGEFLAAIKQWQDLVPADQIISLKKSGMNSLANALIESKRTVPGAAVLSEEKIRVR